MDFFHAGFDTFGCPGSLKTLYLPHPIPDTKEQPQHLAYNCFYNFMLCKKNPIGFSNSILSQLSHQELTAQNVSVGCKEEAFSRSRELPHVTQLIATDCEALKHNSLSVPIIVELTSLFHCSHTFNMQVIAQKNQSRSQKPRQDQERCKCWGETTYSKLSWN